MRAVRLHGAGGVGALAFDDIPTPEPGPGEVLIQVAGAGVNYSDTHAVQRGHGILDGGSTMGREASGVVVAVGADVSDVGVGERVMARAVKGAWAEYAIADAPQTFPCPNGLDLVHAGGLPMVFTTAYHMLKTRGALQPGETVLVHAAASGVGTAATQIAKAWGARVIATASTAEKLALAQSLGADVLINYAEQDFEQAVLRETGGEGVDIALDGVGGQVTLKTANCLKEFWGRLVFYGHSSNQVAQIPTTLLHPGSRPLLGFSMGSAPGHLHKPAMAELRTLFESGRIHPVIDRVLPMAEAAAAVQHLADRGAMGKVVLIPNWG